MQSEPAARPGEVVREVSFHGGDVIVRIDADERVVSTAIRRGAARHRYARWAERPERRGVIEIRSIPPVWTDEDDRLAGVGFKFGRTSAF